MEECKKLNKVFLYAQTALVAFYIDVPALNQILVSYFPGLSGRLMVLLYILCGIILLVLSAISGRNRVNAKLLIVVIYVSTGYLMTLFFTPYSDLSIVNYGVYTLMALLIVLFCQVDGKLLVALIMIFPIIGVFKIERIFVTSSYLYETISMGLSYAFMPTVVSMITYIYFFYRDTERKQKLAIIPVFLVNIIYMVKIVQFGSRGPVLTFLCCFIIFSCLKYDDINKKVKFKGYNFLLFALVIALVILNFWTVLERISDFMEFSGIKLNVVNKFFRLIQSSGGDVSNGRNFIFAATIDGIWQSLFWGHGYSTTMYNLGFVYPHNFLLQFLYDGGLFLTVPIILLVISGFMKWLKSCSKNEFAAVSALLLMSVPSALLSGNLWENNRLWLTFAVMIIYSKKQDFFLIKKDIYE